MFSKQIKHDAVSFDILCSGFKHTAAVANASIPGSKYSLPRVICVTVTIYDSVHTIHRYCPVLLLRKLNFLISRVYPSDVTKFQT